MAESANDMQAVIDAARGSVPPQTIYENGARATVFVPDAKGPGALRTVDLEAGLPAPLRKRGSFTVFDATSLMRIMTENADSGNHFVYLDRTFDSPSIVAILNEHGQQGPGWRDLRVTMQFRQSPEWKKWLAMDGRLMAQDSFAEFLEDNTADILEPGGAEMVGIASELAATKTTQFRSAKRLSDGQVQFVHTEDLQASVSAGQIAVPNEFKIKLAPVLGVTPFAVVARFRYRLNDGKLSMGYKLQRLETVMETVFMDVLATLQFPYGVTVVEGLPPDLPKA